MSHRPQTQSVEDWIGDGRIEAYPIPTQGGSMSDTTKAATPVPRPKTSDESKEK